MANQNRFGIGAFAHAKNVAKEEATKLALDKSNELKALKKKLISVKS